MSFENKGFPNDLNERYFAMNNERDTYAPKSQPMSTGLKLNAVGLPDYNDFLVNPSAITGVVANIKSGKIKSGEGKEKVKDVANDIGSFFKKLFSSDEDKKEERRERRSERKERRKQRRYKRKGNKIVKIDEDGDEVEVTNATEKAQAVAEINTPIERLPKSATVLAPIEQPAFIKTDLPEFVINAPAKKKNKTIYYILSALILLIAIYFIYTYVKKKN